MEYFKRKLLLADSDGVFREKLAAAMRQRGYATCEAANAKQAVALALQHNFDAALVDLMTPEGNGVSLIRRLRELLPAARLVVLTGYGSIASAMSAVRCGANDYLTKPLGVERVEAAVRGMEIAEDDESYAVPSLDRVEWEHLQRVLVDCRRNISRAARTLGIDRRTLQRKLAKVPYVQ